MDKPYIIDARDFIRNNFVAALATSYINMPYISTIYYTTDDKFNIYFLTKMNTDKYLNIKSNKNVAVTIGLGPKHIAVKIRGHATIIKEKKKRDQIMKEIEAILAKQTVENWPIRKTADMQAKNIMLNEEIVYKVIPQHLVFTNLDDSTYPNSISNERHHIIPVPRK